MTEKIKPISQKAALHYEFNEGRGFSRAEIKAAGKTKADMKSLGLNIDVRRRSVHEKNVEALKAMPVPEKKKKELKKKTAAKSDKSKKK